MSEPPPLDPPRLAVDGRTYAVCVDDGAAAIHRLRRSPADESWPWYWHIAAQSRGWPSAADSMSEVTRAEFDDVVGRLTRVEAQVGALTDLITGSVAPKLDTAIGLLTSLSAAVVERFDGLERAISTAFGAVDQRFDKLDATLEKVLQRLPPPE